jgi:hypothetical protein
LKVPGLVRVELHPQVARIGKPADLIPGIEDHSLRYQANQYGTFSHAK